MKISSQATTTALDVTELTAAITAAAARLRLPPQQLEQHRLNALRRTLMLARERSPFYAERLAGIDVEQARPTDLSQVEPTTKTDLIAELDRIVTRPDIDTEKLEAHVAALTAPEPLGDVQVFASSGSSGRRALSPMLHADVVRNCAAMFACMLTQARRTTRERPSCTVGIGGAHPAHLSATTSEFFQLLGPAARTEVIPASTPIESVIAIVADLDPTAIMGFPSVIARLARAQLRGELSLEPESVISIGEPLPAEDAEAMTRAWGCPIHSAYGCSELGWLAITVGSGGPMLHFDDQFVIEPIGGDQESTSVCFTTLDRDEFPLIRYELADRVRTLPPDSESPSACSRIESVVGRDDEWFRYGGLEVHPTTFRGELLEHPAVDEYQVRQTPAGVRVLIVPAGRDLASSDIERGLRRTLSNAGLPGAEVDVELVGSLERPGGQKLRRFIPDPKLTPPGC